jgi:hypothetical protein
MNDISNALGEDFIPDNYETQDNSPVPPGNYPVVVEKAEVKTTKRGDGNYLWLQLSITGDNHANRKLFTNINLKNPSQEAERIGRSELASLGKAIGLTAIRDSGELIDRALIVHVKVKDDQNEVTAFKPLDGSRSSAPAQRPAASRPAQPVKQPAASPSSSTATSAPKKMPWSK